MPWLEKDRVKLRREFVLRALAPDANVSALCREYGISRKVGYKWLKRFRTQGEGGLVDRSKRPRSSPLETSGDMVLEVIELRRQHPHWGGLKLWKLLERKHGSEAPSIRTVERILKRAGLVKARKKRRVSHASTAAPTWEATNPNDIWTVDFKGWWRTTNGSRCEPLTVRDAASRFLLDIRILPSTKGQYVREVFEALFDSYGLPDAIQSDNGAPFASTQSLAGLTQLSAWWAVQGIQLLRGRPGCPQDNGAHERVHTDMRIELEDYPQWSVEAQQDACDIWRNEFNHVRPHQALGLKTPAEVYKPSTRRYASTVIGGFPDDCELRVVGKNGKISFRNEPIFLSKALAGHHVGLEPVDGETHRIWLCAQLIGELRPDNTVSPPTTRTDSATRADNQCDTPPEKSNNDNRAEV